MPAAYKRCVRKVRAKGHSTSSAHAICTAANAGNIKAVRRRERLRLRLRSRRRRRR